MGAFQVIETAGAERLVVIPESEYLRLVEAAEDLEDIALAVEAEARRADGLSHYVDLDGTPVALATQSAA